MNAFSSAAYWEQRYQNGGTSGSGSYGHLARFKADFINGFLHRHAVTSVIDMGCGDGHLLGLLEPPCYTGVDVSPTTLARCALAFPLHRFVPMDRLSTIAPAELTMSIDVLFHLIEDETFTAYMSALFAYARRYVVIYSSNVEMAWFAPHVRHRRFTDHVEATQPEWALLGHVPNAYPFDPHRPDDTSFADFFIYERIPATPAS